MVEKFIQAGFIGLLLLGLAFLLAFPAGFAVMLALGVVHGIWSQVPSFGFLECVVLITAWRAIHPIKVSEDAK